MVAKNIYSVNKSYGPFTITEEIGTVLYNDKKMPQFKVKCHCGAESVKTRDQLANSERKGHRFCVKCKDHGKSNYVAKTGRTCVPGEIPAIGLAFIHGRVA